MDSETLVDAEAPSGGRLSPEWCERAEASPGLLGLPGKQVLHPPGGRGMGRGMWFSPTPSAGTRCPGSAWLGRRLPGCMQVTSGK
jgi:hypothetical protein